MFRRRFKHVLTRSAHLKGTLRFEKLLLLEGQMDGDLIGTGTGSGVLVRGRANGPISADTVYVEGEVTGNIVAKEVIIYAGGIVRGHLQVETLHLLKGGQVHGQISMSPATASPEAAERTETGSAQLAKARLLDLTSPSQPQLQDV